MARWIALAMLACLAAGEKPFVVRIVDDVTGRGVPLVELRLRDESLHYTDSNGVIAFTEPWLFGIEVHYEMQSHGYDKGEGSFEIVSAGEHRIPIHRRNIAERLYRITGAGIYRDSVIAGLPVPLKHPLLNGKVVGQDTAVAVPYAGKLYWIWGDTFGPNHMLFSVSGATSELPGKGGLDPDKGIDLTYFTGPDGFSKAMLPLPCKGLVWIEGMLTTKDPSGHERLLATYTLQQGLKPAEERGVAVFDHDKEQFVVLKHWPGDGKRFHRSSHPVRVVDEGRAYWYLYPDLRVPDDWNAIQDPAKWEQRKAELPPKIHGSIAWNAYRNKWIMIAGSGGSTWYLEGEKPEGPWSAPIEIVSHDNYTFYNVVHHPFFDKEDGRVIYFEGTYTDAFSSAKMKTPLYNYNQIMYKLRLDDPRIRVP